MTHEDKLKFENAALKHDQNSQKLEINILKQQLESMQEMVAKIAKPISKNDDDGGIKPPKIDIQSFNDKIDKIDDWLDKMEDLALDFHWTDEQLYREVKSRLPSKIYNLLK